MKKKRKVILVIRDGWGYRKEKLKNAIFEAITPVTDKLMREYPNVLINTSGSSVGLPDGYQGNSEVGHMTIGSGRIIYSSLERINHSIKDKSFFKNIELVGAINNCKKNKSNLHIFGLIQVEGVHSHINHLFALLELCKKEKFFDVLIHVITDGRDSPVNDSLKNIKLLKEKIEEVGVGKVVSVSGRYYTMDRNKRWERTKLSYDCIVEGKCLEEFDNIINIVKKCHKDGETDEFIKPRKVVGYKGIEDGDSVIFFNYRTDRTRQLTQAICEPDFKGFSRDIKKVYYVGMTSYYKSDNFKVAFKDLEIKNILGEVISKNGLRQLRISETEKYAHVTFFFNSQIEKPFLGEDRILIQSPMIATYDLKPEMSVFEISKKLVKEIKSEKYDFIVTNLVNCDMVGHTGDINAILKAINSVDKATGEIVSAGLESGYDIMIFADHGNCEDYSKKWMTSHTINPVPLIFISNDLKSVMLKSGCGLSNIAPTVLGLMGLDIPKEMGGESLIEKK
ncbi:2,3-bisphosphoglycerate-independent phosphoglycerate mutase [Candidatus Pacearchaeota archaeon]|nr:2,3-bisphosphoglycerate-independent phosphoglycerate mutase [Candidatus Pacearchaeota archaeon]